MCAATTLCFEPGLLAEIKRDDQLTVRVQSLVDSITADIRKLCQLVARYPLRPRETGKLPAKPKMTSPLDKMLNSPGKIIGNLKQAARFISKCVHDLPLMPDHLGVPPTLVERARICVDSARILGALQAINLALSVDFEPPKRINKSLRDDFLGVGKAHETLFANVFDLHALPYDRQVITCRPPGADALVGSWMSERYIFFDKRCLIRFVPTLHEVRSLVKPGDAVVDIGGWHDPEYRLFDHQPPFLKHVDETCATKLVLRYLLIHNFRVDHLRYLADLIHDGEAASRRDKSWTYDESKRFGFHAHFGLIKKMSDSEMLTYRAAALWLDGNFV